MSPDLRKISRIMRLSWNKPFLKAVTFLFCNLIHWNPSVMPFGRAFPWQAQIVKQGLIDGDVTGLWLEVESNTTPTRRRRSCVPIWCVSKLAGKLTSVTLTWLNSLFIGGVRLKWELTVVNPLSLLCFCMLSLEIVNVENCVTSRTWKTLWI